MYVPPSHRPVAHVNSGPLAHNHTESTGLATFAAAPPETQPPQMPPPPPTTHPLDYGSQSQQQRPNLASGGGGGDSGGGGDTDPLSHLLLRPGGMQMERDTAPTLAPPAAEQQPEPTARFDFSSNPPAGAQTLPPPLAAEPAVPAGGGWGGDGGAPGMSRAGGGNGVGEDNVSMSSFALFWKWFAGAWCLLPQHLGHLASSVACTSPMRVFGCFEAPFPSFAFVHAHLKSLAAGCIVLA